MRQEVTFQVVNLGSFDKRSDLGGGQVRLVEFFGNTKSGDERAVNSVSEENEYRY